MLDWWIRRWSALLASPRFQRLALRFPLTRPIGRRRARRLFDTVAGFTYAQTLAACVELNLFERLRGGPMSAAALAADAGLAERAFQRLVGAAAALRLLAPLRDGRVALGADGAALLGNPGIAAMVAHHRLLYADLADPLALLRNPGGGALAAFWAYARSAGPAEVEPYSRLMAASVAPVAEQLFAAYPLARHRRLLDVGGGEGAFLAAIRARGVACDLGLFDLPAVAERARARLGDGVCYHPGDFRSDPLPTGYDCVTLVRVVHDHDDATVLALLRAVRRALPGDGALLIVEPMLDTAGADRVGATYFAWYLLALGAGSARSPRELGRLARAAGFRRCRHLPTPLPLAASVLLATP